MTATGSSLELNNLVKHFGRLKVLDNVSTRIEAGSFTAILGPSGSGKSTLLMTIAGFEMPESGAVVIDGVDVTQMPPEKRGIGMVFQGYALFPHMTIADNIAYPLKARGWAKEAIRKRVAEMAAMMEIEQLLQRRPQQLSGGQRQRVAIARALAFEPRLLLLDEPLSALDRNLRDRMQAELKRLHRKIGVTIIMVTHDQDEASALADNIIVMESGGIIATGGARELYERPQSARIASFFGRANLFPVARRTDAVIETPVFSLAAEGIEGEGSQLLVRPEAFAPCGEGDGFAVEVVSTIFHAGRISLTAATDTGDIISADLDDAGAGHLVPGAKIRLRAVRARLIAA